MAHAYTPGLRVTRRATVRKRRQLPLKGEVLVSGGDRVRRDQVVARTNLPGDVTTLNLVNRLGVIPSELSAYMLKQEGETVEVGETIAETRPFIKWFKTTVESPVAGTVESLSSVTGQVLLREPPRRVEIQAFVDGWAVEIIPDEGVVIETRGAFIQGIFGVGGERWGPIHLVTDAPDQDLSTERLDSDCRDKILVSGRRITLEGVRRARELGAAGVIGGGIRDQDLRELLGYDLGVAITGTEEIGLTVIVTEGFGEIRMAERTFEILADHSGMDASVSGATQIRAGVMRPEIIVPDPSGVGDGGSETGPLEEGLGLGALLRIIRSPYFGRIGRVTALPTDLQKVSSEAMVRVLEVELEDGTRTIVPRANVELMAE